jgi:hypothetical protein
MGLYAAMKGRSESTCARKTGPGKEYDCALRHMGV